MLEKFNTMEAELYGIPEWLERNQLLSRKYWGWNFVPKIERLRLKWMQFHDEGESRSYLSAVEYDERMRSKLEYIDHQMLLYAQ